jgi:hypothetical protein
MATRSLVRRLGPLAETHPHLVVQWHPHLNGPLRPADVTGGSNRRVWWICPVGHEWLAQVGSRARAGTGCPYCAGTRPSAQTCLAATRPDLAAEWHPFRNGRLAVSEVSAGSSRMVWWRCSQGHEWEARIRHRAREQHRCPACARERARTARLAAAGRAPAPAGGPP